MIDAKNGRLHGNLDAFEAEVLSCREALYWLKMNGYSRVMVETDCLLLVSALINRPSAYLNSRGLIIQY